MDHDTPTHIFFVDDEPKIRMVVRKTLGRAGMRVSCFRCAEDCLAQLGIDRCDLLITDVKMPGKDGVQLLMEARERLPWLPVLVITGYGDVPMAVKALKAGAADFIEKPLDRDDFLATVQEILEQSVPQNSVSAHALTRAEMRVLALILEGKNNREIADILHRSPRTIEVHRSHLMHKMGANNVVELLRIAADMGLFDLGAGEQGTGDN